MERDKYHRLLRAVVARFRFNVLTRQQNVTSVNPSAGLSFGCPLVLRYKVLLSNFMALNTYTPLIASSYSLPFTCEQIQSIRP